MQPSKAYAAVAKQTASPRELESTLLLKAAHKLQSAYDNWDGGRRELGDAVLYNRRLWTVFLDSVSDNASQLPVPVRQNLANIGVFVMAETLSLMTNPKPQQLLPLININREIAAGLRGKN